MTKEQHINHITLTLPGTLKQVCGFCRKISKIDYIAETQYRIIANLENGQTVSRVRIYFKKEHEHQNCFELLDALDGYIQSLPEARVGELLK